MKKTLLDTYVCPISHGRLLIAADDKSAAAQKEISDGYLSNGKDLQFAIRDGIPSFLPHTLLTEEERRTQADYDETAEQKYDAAVDWLFHSFYEDEDKVREQMLDHLHLKPDARILEIGSGTGRDSFRIARRLGPGGHLFVQDLSEQMIRQTRKRLELERKERGLKVEINYFVSTARFLPFADGFFDAVFHFGGFNNFSEPKATLAEMARIVRQRGRVVFGDESLPPWLEGTEFGEIIETNNPLFRHKIPLPYLPANAREVTARWILGGCFYLIDFSVGEGPPPVNLDLPHKGWRGGSLRTRYYGRLEGVTPEVRELALAAAKRQGLSLHAWLDATVRRAAEAGEDSSADGQTSL